MRFSSFPFSSKATAVTLAILLGLMLTACDKKKGPPITGEREAVFVGDDPLKADARLKDKEILLPQGTQNKNWPTASGDTSHALDPVMLNPDFKKVWSDSIGQGSGASERLLNGPIAAEGTVFAVDTRGFVTAVELETGKEKWAIDSTPENRGTQAFSGGLAYENGFVFVVTPTAEVVMMDAKTGEIKKRFALTAPVRSAPTVKDGYIYIVNINNQLEVLNYQTGEPAWSHAGIMEVAGLLGGASPALKGDLLIVPYTSGEVYALHPGNGLPLWTESLVSLSKLDPISSLFHIKARPVIKDKYVYLIGNGGVMRCLDATTGKTVWSHKVGGIRSPAVSGDYIFLVTSNNEITCMNRFDGGVYWVKQLPRFKNEEKKEDALLWAGPVLVNDQLVLAGSNGQALMLSIKDGSTTKEIDLGDATMLSPIVAEGTLIFLTDRAELIAYR